MKTVSNKPGTLADELRTRRREATLRRSARRLAAEVESVRAKHPDADPEDVRHTLILLRMRPWERLERSLRRGRATAVLSR